MQFYLNGYKPGDPFIEDPHPSVAEFAGWTPLQAQPRPVTRLRPRKDT
jgi:phenol 2-monooxygenase (NADPH)